MAGGGASTPWGGRSFNATSGGTCASRTGAAAATPPPRFARWAGHSAPPSAPATGRTCAAAAASDRARAAAASRAGFAGPGRVGTEVVARLLGLRTNHPAQLDSIELLPTDPATRAEAAYSVAQILHFSGWEAAGVQSLADGFSLPQLTPWQTKILDTAGARVGVPDIWGGTGGGPATDFRLPARGGSGPPGLAWRVVKREAGTRR